VRAGLMSGLVFALYLVVVQFEVAKECRGGAFSAGFSSGFDVPRCAMVIRKIGSDGGIRIPLPQ
jgi:hypothetical protein